MNEGRSYLSEARYALSLLCCVLVVIGYIALNRLGGTGEGPVVESRPEVVQPVAPDDDSMAAENDLPQVLQVEPATEPALLQPQQPAERIASPTSPEQQPVEQPQLR
jgi:hypothetical protein